MRQDTLPAERARPALISATELADLLQISTRTLWRLRSAGKLVEPIKLGGSTRWRLDVGAPRRAGAEQRLVALAWGARLTNRAAARTMTDMMMPT